MYIKKIKIRNYRNFSDPPFEMDLKPFTVIVGENNVGKTNLLNAMGLIFSQEIMIFRKRVLEIDDINYTSVEAFKDCIKNLSVSPSQIEFPIVSVEVILTDLDDNQEAVVGDWFINKDLTEAKITYQFTPSANFDKVKWIEKQRELIKAKAELANDNTMLIDFPIENYRYSIYGGDDPSNECNMYFLKMLKMEFLNALRDAQKELIASGEYRLLYRVLLQKDKEKYDDIKTSLQKLSDVVNQNLNLKSIRDDVTKVLDKLSLQAEESENSIDFIFSSPEASELLKKISMVYGTNPIRVDRNGLGRNNLLYISLILSHLSTQSVEKDHAFFRLIAIEEPEAHLHPHLQDHLAANMESMQTASGKGMQLLITTHSTHIAAKVDLNNSVIIFNDINSTPVSHYILSGIDKKKEQNTIHHLSKYIDATKSRMFFARKIILVEGISEQLLIPLFYKNVTDKTLEKTGCTIINVNGVAFSHFLKIIRSGFYIKGLVLTDSDTGKRTEERAVELKKNFDQEGLILVEFSGESTFERDMIKANRAGKGKEILLNSLKLTKPERGPAYEKEIGDRELDIDSFFSEIEHYKSEFAFNLSSQLQVEANWQWFCIPEYIAKGLQFIDQ